MLLTLLVLAMTISPFPAETIPADGRNDIKDADSTGLEVAFFVPYFRGTKKARKRLEADKSQELAERFKKTATPTGSLPMHPLFRALFSRHEKARKRR